MHQQAHQDQRGGDRREQPTSVWDLFRPNGKREQARRADEHQQPYFVDRFSATTFTLVLCLLGFTVLDGMFTLLLMGTECEEANPIMRYLMSKGNEAFMLGKYVLTAAGLPVLLIFKNFYLFRTRFRVGYLLPIFVAMYVALLSYEAWLLHFVSKR